MKKGAPNQLTRDAVDGLVDQLQLEAHDDAHDRNRQSGGARKPSQHEPSRRHNAFANFKIAHVPLNRIRISAESRALQARMGPLPGLTLDERYTQLALVVHPPVVMADPDHANLYLTVDDARIVEWLTDRMRSAGSGKSKVSVLVIEAPLVAMSAVVAARALMVPLVIGTLSARAAKKARQQLRQADIPRPRKRSSRRQLARLVNR